VEHPKADLFQPRSTIVLACLIAVFLTTASPYSFANAFIIYGLADLDFGQWDDSGAVSTSALRCVESRKGNKERNYRLSFTNSLGTGGFYLYLDGNGSNTDANRIAIDIFEKDLFYSNSYQAVTPGSNTTNRKGQNQACPSGNNFQYRVDIASAELATANPGSYTGTFTVSGQGGQNYSRSDTDTFSVFVEVLSSEPQVKISGLDNILATSGATNTLGLSVDEYFCVYSEAGGYQVTVTSSVTSSGSFALAGANESLLPIDVSFADNTAGTGLSSVEGSTASGSGDTSSPSCSGGNNAMLRVQASDADLSASSTGSYTATLTVLVEPL